MKQTAVEWLIQKYKVDGHISIETEQQAKAIEERLTIDTYLTGLNNCYFNYNLTNEQKHILNNN